MSRVYNNIQTYINDNMLLALNSNMKGFDLILPELNSSTVRPSTTVKSFDTSTELSDVSHTTTGSKEVSLSDQASTRLAKLDEGFLVGWPTTEPEHTMETTWVDVKTEKISTTVTAKIKTTTERIATTNTTENILENIILTSSEKSRETAELSTTTTRVTETASQMLTENPMLTETTMLTENPMLGETRMFSPLSDTETASQGSACPTSQCCSVSSLGGC